MEIRAIKDQDLLLSHSYVISTRRKVFVDKKRIKDAGISINENLIKRRMEFLNKAKNDFGFNNVWVVDRRIFHYDDVAKKVKVDYD